MTAQLKMAAQTEATGPFVINLCSSTTPMALTQTRAPELKRFNFFVSRRRADGRDRFYLHMGHFMTLAEAEEWVNAVRDIYPGAWAGEAPGKKLAQRAAAAAAPQISPVPDIAAADAVVPVASVAPIAPQTPAIARPVDPPLSLVEPAAPVVVPTLQAATAPAVVSTPKPASAAVPATKAPIAPNPAAVASPVSPKPVAAAGPAKTSLPPGSNVREVLKSLDDTGGATRMMPVQAVEPPTLTDTAVLKILEDRRVEKHPRGGELAAKGIELLRPDDTATVRALKEAVQENQPVSFAVQLQWSVQPIDLTSVPPLAIFSAYMLYTVEGSRDGRKWYGLRLGFFGDAISAKQVASYVRSEFTSVAVIPVSTQERGRATVGDPKAAKATEVHRQRAETERKTEDFKLLDDVTDDIVSPGLMAAQSQLKSATMKRPTAAAPAKRKALGRVRASEKRTAKSLEETLEILGASDLEIDKGRGELINDSGVRHLSVQVQAQKNSPFARLLDRLTERVKKA